MDVEVLVVGAGPTGLMLANQLVRRGVRTTIVDRHAGPSRETRALGVQARTLEIYSYLGIAERALELGKLATGANLWAQGHHAARIPLGDIGRELSRYPFLLILGQDDNEMLLGGMLRNSGLEVQWNTELTALEQESDKVIATLRQPDGTMRHVSAAWVAGCDGAHSMVRRLNAIEFVGAPYEQVFFVADTQATGSMRPEEINVYFWREGFHLFFPMRGSGHWRVVGIVSPELRDKAGLTFDEVMPAVRSQAGSGLSFGTCSWFSAYRIHHRRAERFRDRRCFLLGDAAHIHSPVGAQGMNTGLQDAYNLGWKLALVVSGRADAALLDTYQDERLPVADRLLSTTDRAFSVAVSEGVSARVFRLRVLAKIMALAMQFERVRRFVFRAISQIGIRYRRSRLSETAEGFPPSAPRAGDRFPWLRVKLEADGPVEDVYARLDDTRFNLVVVGQSVPDIRASGLADLLRVLEIPVHAENDGALEQAQIPTPSFFLLRPDGHIGLAGVRLDEAVLKRYVTSRLLIRSA